MIHLRVTTAALCELLLAAVSVACSGGGANPAQDASMEPIEERDGGDMQPRTDAGVDAGGEAPPVDDRDVCRGAARGTVCEAGKHCIEGNCAANVCGDQVGAGSEECDDGNTRDGDGCDLTCKLEPCMKGPDGKPVADCEGGVSIEIAFNHCPRIVSYTAAPSQANVGKRIELFSAAEDGDSDAVSVQWKSKDGDFGNASAPNTTYGCESAGAKVLDLIVKDRDGCEDSAKIRVTCVDVGMSVRGGVQPASGVTD